MKTKADKHREAGTLDRFRARQAASRAGTAKYQLALREALYTDSTPHLHIGDSAFEDWFQQQPFACQPGIKQIARDAYAAGMGDPLVVAKT